MFQGAVSFNCDLSSWDVSSVTDTSYMFVASTSFTGNLSSWDVSSVTNMYQMFKDAKSYNGDLCDWGSRIDTLIDVTDMFTDTSCPVTSDPDLSTSPPGPFCVGCSP
jgi:surface protein